MHRFLNALARGKVMLLVLTVLLLTSAAIAGSTNEPVNMALNDPVAPCLNPGDDPRIGDDPDPMGGIHDSPDPYAVDCWLQRITDKLTPLADGWNPAILADELALAEQAGIHIIINAGDWYAELAPDGTLELTAIINYGRSINDDIDPYGAFYPYGTCDSLTDCTRKIEDKCRDRGSSGESSRLAKNDLGTQYCDGTCADGTIISVFCVTVSRPNFPHR